MHKGISAVAHPVHGDERMRLGRTTNAQTLTLSQRHLFVSSKRRYELAHSIHQSISVGSSFSRTEQSSLYSKRGRGQADSCQSCCSKSSNICHSFLVPTLATRSVVYQTVEWLFGLWRQDYFNPLQFWYLLTCCILGQYFVAKRPLRQRRCPIGWLPTRNDHFCCRKQQCHSSQNSATVQYNSRTKRQSAAYGPPATVTESRHS